MEMETACRYNLPIKIVVLNNGGIGGGIAELPEDRSQTPPRVLTVGARYDKMMEAFGGFGRFIEDPADLRGALDEAMAFPGPALVNVRLHPEAGRKPQQFGWHTS
jgi:thiamine pyrophosphate-dependent acetolactate synthase large subunit-like protein